MRPVEGRPLQLWLIGLVIVVAAGLAAAGLTYGAFWLLNPDDGWRDLAAFAAGLVFGIGTATLGWLVLLIVLVRRHVPAGRQVAVGAVAVGALAVTAVGLAALAAGAGDGVRWLGMAPGAVAIGVTCLVAGVVPPVVVRGGAGGDLPET